MSVNVALIGLGHWGKNHLEALLNHMREIAERYDLPFETNIDIILNNPEIHAVQIVTPTDTHFSIGSKALSAGKHVLIEKPLGVTTKECDTLIKTAKENSRILMVGHLFRYHPAIRKLKELLDQGYFGSVYSIDIIRKSMRAPRSDSGVLLSLAIHDVDLACYLFKILVPESIYCVSQSFLRNYPDESSIILMEFPNSGMAKVESSWLNPTIKSIRTLELIGSRRSAFLDFLKPNELVIRNGHIEMKDGEPQMVQGSSETIETYPGMPLDIEVSHFIDCIKFGKEPLTPGAVGREAVAMIEAAIHSLNTGKVQRMTG
jgi:UDP-N-acetylglucosamine 3-dehydrogenase